MKFCLSVFIAFIFCASCRTASFTTVKISGFGQGELAFPKVRYVNKDVEKKINTFIVSAMLGEDVENDSVFYDKLHALSEFVSDLHHTVTYNKNRFLSFYILSENCGAYCVTELTYFNFDMRTGEIVELPDLLQESMSDSFISVLKNRIRKEWTDYGISDLDSLPEVDSTVHDWVIESLQTCLADINVYGFSVYPDKVEFSSECNFPRAIRPYQPHSDFPFSLAEMASYLKPKYLTLLQKK